MLEDHEYEGIFPKWLQSQAIINEIMSWWTAFSASLGKRLWSCPRDSWSVVFCITLVSTKHIFFSCQTRVEALTWEEESVCLCLCQSSGSCVVHISTTRRRNWSMVPSMQSGKQVVSSVHSCSYNAISISVLFLFIFCLYFKHKLLFECGTNSWFCHVSFLSLLNNRKVSFFIIFS